MKNKETKCYHPLADIWENEFDEDWGELYGIKDKKIVQDKENKCYHPLADIWENEFDEDWGELYEIKDKTE